VIAKPEPVELDDATIDIARQVARPPWYASWVGVVMVAGPLLTLMAGTFGGDDTLIAVGMFSLLFLSCGGAALVAIWLVLLIRHRSRVRPIRQAIKVRRAWSVTGSLGQVFGTMSVDDQEFITLRRARIPDWASTAPCTVVFTDAGSAHDFGSAGQRIAIKITGPSGQQIYPETGLVPTFLQVPAIVASILVGIAFTAACNAQSRTYNEAASRLHDIEAAAPCATASKVGDDCSRWVAGTVEKTGILSNSSGSSCFVMLRWGNSHQEGEIRTDGTDCNQQLSPSTWSPMPAQIQLVKGYAVQAKVGATVYRTDRWPPYGDTVFALALIFRLATILWLTWPILHIVAAILYRLRRAMSAPPAGIPSPPAPELGSAT
jgi:hypothetical protein